MPPPPSEGGGVPPPLQPPKLSNTPRVHTLAGGGPRASPPVLLFQNLIVPGSAMSATLIVATSPIRRKHTKARVARALRRCLYLDLDAFSTRMTIPVGERYGCGRAEVPPAAIFL